MDNPKESLQEIVPNEEKGNLDKYPDILKSPMNEISSKKSVLKDALDGTAKNGENLEDEDSNS